MPLRSYVANHEAHVMSQLVLDRQIVLRRVLRAHVRLELSKQQDRTEYRPVHRLAPWRIQDSIERIGIYRCPILPQEGQVELGVNGESTSAEWRLCTELLEYQLLNWIVEHAPSGTNAGLA